MSAVTPGSAAIASELDTALRSPGTYGAEGPVRVCDTHAARVYLVGELAFKVKKPVKFAFLDYSSRERRRAACRAELEVNRVLAPDIYLGVVALVRDGDRIALAAEGAGAALDYAVMMRRFDETQTLAGAIARHTVKASDIEAVARRLASFHARTRVAGSAGRDDLLARWRTNVQELKALACGAGIDLAGMESFAEAFLAAHAQEIDQRARGGYVRDCHGDLRCEHVLLGEPVRIVDRIEFDPALRQMDVASDLAFLAMDLADHHRPRLAAQLLAAYDRAGGSAGSAALQGFYGAYWALVRAKVELLGGAHGEANGEPGHHKRASELIALAERLCWTARGPLVIVICGPPASGKSTLAGALARRSGFALLCSDVLRKRRAGIEPTQRAGGELYSRAATLETYSALGAAAAAKLKRSGGVIVDASCRTRELRALLLRALDPRARRLIVHCHVSEATALARARARMHEPRRVSDATPELVRDAFGSFEPPSELDQESLVSLDCELPLERQLQSLSATVDARLSGLQSASATPFPWRV